jgi:hypothetical protein
MILAQAAEPLVTSRTSAPVRFAPVVDSRIY